MGSCKDPEKEKERRRKISLSHTGKPSGMLGKKLSDHSKELISIALKGKPKSATHRENIRKNTPRGESHCMFGKHPSEETLKKLRVSHKKEKNWAFGKTFSKEYRDKLSKSHIGLQVGDKNGKWKGGTSFLPYCPKFNEKLKQNVRDFFGNKCVLCKRTKEENNGENLSVHHVFTEKMACCENRIEEMELIRERLPIGIAQFGNDEFTEEEIMYIRMMVPLCHSCHSKQGKKSESLPYEQTKYRKFFTELILNEYGGKCYSEKYYPE